jgi:hypothetical protein
MTRAARTVDRLLVQLASDDPEKPSLQARAVEYGRDCGCTLGALFLTAAVPLAALYVVAWAGLNLRTGLASVAFVFVAASVGKLTGLLLATLRLRLLGRSIARRLDRQRARIGHVHLH